MVYILDPDRHVFASHPKSKADAIGEAVRRYDSMRPVIRASVMRDVWMRMLEKGYSLREEARN